MQTQKEKSLLILLLVYGAASLIHFIHNAEFLSVYPGLPTTWTRAGVYSAWLLMTGVGITGWLLAVRGYRMAGFLILAIYALLGLDSLGHYVVAPLTSHTAGMNLTILLEVCAAAMVLLEIAKRVIKGRLK